MTRNNTSMRLAWRWFAALVFGLFSISSAWAQDADILMIVGRVEVGASAQGPWVAAAVRQKLNAGSFVRTLEGSQVALLLRDQTQVRLNQNSVLEIKSMQAGEEATSLSLLQGRLWAQVKQLSVGTLRAVTGLVGRQQVRISTPTATIGIRGTDWELVVGERDTTTVTVFSGEVEMSNSLGMIAVGPNEQGVVEAGKAPVKSLLSNARDRVQWVTAYRPAPARWLHDARPAYGNIVRDIEAGEYARGLGALERLPDSRERAMLLADMYIFLGRANDAIGLLEPYSRKGAGDPMASALLARALLVAGRIDDASVLLQSAHSAHPGDREVVLALGDAARLQGDASAALRWFTQATLAHPQSHEAWFGLGRVETEKENVGAATRALDEAIRLAPNAPGYHGERATLLALTGNASAARAAFDEALKRQPDDYLAWTGLGILQLKTGETREALDSFLKAGVIEPRFARAQLYVGVAYYQLGNQQRALESVRKAAELDAKDPLPYVMLSLMHGDAQELADAVEASRQAQERMPYLKSLNQLLNNQKGSANVGSALAARGMEEWAQNYATSSYNPYWAGSALFLADRYTDGFNKNSELFRGFLLDPTSFGASNRFSSLVASPGHYGSIGLKYERGDFNQGSVLASANGLSTAKIPFAYSIIGDLASGHATPRTFSGDGGNLTLGLGMKPNHDVNLFYFGTRTLVDGRFTSSQSPFTASLTDAPLDVAINRQDLGLAYRLAPDNQFMLKYGAGGQKTRLFGDFFHAAQVAVLNGDPVLAVLQPFDPAGRLDNYGTNVRQNDFQFNHSFNVSPTFRLSWGLEHGEERRDLNFTRTFQSVLTPLVPAVFTDDAVRNLRSSDIYVSGRSKLSDALELQMDVAHQSLRGSANLVQRLDLADINVNLFTTTTAERFNESEFNPRFGLRFTPGAGQQFRVVAQQWRRPISLASLGSVDTLGIPVEDRLVESGGLLRRVRAQYDWQLGNESFMQVFADHRRVNNLRSVTNPLFALFGVSELDSLRARKPVFGQPFDDLEDTPVFGEGEVSSLGLAGNWLLNRDWSLAARYRYSSSRNTGSDVTTGASFAGFSVPFIPRHFANASLYWQASQRWLVSLSATYRSNRFSDEGNLTALDAGWNFGLTGFWESEDKRWTVEAGLTNLHANKRAAKERRAKMLLNAVYRF
jgi:Flp pilus assembly protein TadD